jgi:hypothetical protein
MAHTSLLEYRAGALPVPAIINVSSVAATVAINVSAANLRGAVVTGVQVCLMPQPSGGQFCHADLNASAPVRAVPT